MMSMRMKMWLWLTMVMRPMIDHDAYDAIMRCRRRVFRASPCVAGWQAPAIWVWSAVAGGVGLVLAV